MSLLKKLKTLLCKHEFYTKDMQYRDKYGIVRWPCQKCGKMFEAECGIDILSNGKCVGKWVEPIIFNKTGGGE